MEYKCLGCGVKCKTTTHNLQYRQHFKNEHYCMKCIIRKTKSSKVFDAIPPEFHQQIFDNCIAFDLAVKFLSNISTYINVVYPCNVCGKDCKIRWSKILDRKSLVFERLCYYCMQRKINLDKSDEHSSRSKALWHNIEYRKKCIKSFEKHNKRMQLDPVYANKNKRRSKSVSGSIFIQQQWINFDSAFELLFLHHISDKCKTIRRCKHAIAYFEHYYHPDFFIIFNDGTRAIIEIKGFYKNKVEEKKQAAIDFITETKIADCYILYDTDKLITDGVLTGVGGGHMWRQIKRIYDARIITFAEEKHRRIAEIGQRRYAKEIKNQQNN